MRELKQKPQIVISSRESPTSAQISELNESQFILIAGTNLLNKNFNFLGPDTLATLNMINVPIIPVGIGLGDNVDSISDLSTQAYESLKAVLKNLEENGLSASWRCLRTHQFIEEFCRENSLNTENIMTGCPTLFNNQELSSYSQSRILYSATIRHNFFERELAGINAVIKYSYLNKLSKPCLYLQQPVTWKPSLAPKKLLARQRFNRLIQTAVSGGMELIEPKSIDECFWKLSQFSHHCGSRLHTHITFQAHLRTSLLQAIDNRAEDFAMAFNQRSFVTKDNFTPELLESVFSNLEAAVVAPNRTAWDRFLSRINQAPLR